MNSEQLNKIKRLTGYEYSEIVVMNDLMFWRNITQLLARGALSKEQFEYLDRERTGHGLDQTSINALQVFGGRIIK